MSAETVRIGVSALCKPDLHIFTCRLSLSTRYNRARLVDIIASYAASLLILHLYADEIAPHEANDQGLFLRRSDGTDDLTAVTLGQWRCTGFVKIQQRLIADKALTPPATHKLRGAPLCNLRLKAAYLAICEQTICCSFHLRANMKTLPFHQTGGPSVASRAGRPLKKQLTVKAVAAPELSPKEAGTAGAKNQLDAIKQMSKIVADSGVRFRQSTQCHGDAKACQANDKAHRVRKGTCFPRM